MNSKLQKHKRRAEKALHGLHKIEKNASKQSSHNRQSSNEKESSLIEVRSSRQFRNGLDIAKNNLLSMRLLRESKRGDVHIPDHDRAIVNEAITAKLDPKLIQILLHEYDKACETGGIEDHINHPIHTACVYHRSAVLTILEMFPECAKQRDRDGDAPFTLFLKNEEIGDMSPELYASTIDAFYKMDPIGVRNSILSRDSMKMRALANQLPLHLRSTIDSITSATS